MMLSLVVVILSFCIHFPLVELLDLQNSQEITSADMTDLIQGKEDNVQSPTFGFLFRRYLQRAFLPPNDEQDGTQSVTEDRDTTDVPSHNNSIISSKSTPEPDFWDIVAAIGIQTGRVIHKIVRWCYKLCKSIYSGIMNGWKAEGPLSLQEASSLLL